MTSGLVVQLYSVRGATLPCSHWNAPKSITFVAVGESSVISLHALYPSLLKHLLKVDGAKSIT